MIIIRKNMEAYLRDLKRWLHDTADTPLEEMDEFFTQRVDTYEAHMSLWGEAYRHTAEILPPDTKHLLDLGCGTGLELDEIFKKLPSLHVTGIDLSRAMLQKLLEKHSGKNLEIQCESYFDADFPISQDVVLSFESLHHFTAAEKLPLYRKIYTALRQGGCFMNCDYIACCDEEEALLRTVCDQKRAAGNIPEAQFVHFDTPLTAEHEIAVLHDAGFSDVYVESSINGATMIIARK